MFFFMIADYMIRLNKVRMVYVQNNARYRMCHLRKYPIGDSCLCWSMASDIDLRASQIILRVYRLLKNDFRFSSVIRDIVPSYTALAVHFDPLSTNTSEMTETVEHAFFSVMDNAVETEDNTSKLIRLFVDYRGEDLERVAGLAGLTVREVVERHKAPCYTVAMMGFIPFFPYLIGLDKRIETPRLSSPRIRVPAGSVAIGGAQTGIYPSQSPGGWNIIGLTDTEPLARLEPGDRVIFYEDKDS